jgi:ABC-type polysaccharide/polyol phosphate transport system ATPase subunit
MDDSIAISCRGVGKQFYHYEVRTQTLQELFIRWLKRSPTNVRKPLFRLTDFDLTVRRGETVGLIGPNGSGKSTILRLIAGIYTPTEGTVETHGRLAAVIELGAGINPELSGTNNVELYGLVMGLTRRQLRSRFDDIVAFAGIRPFMDMPMKYYSTGMRARLAFAVNICLDPDILLIDEVLAVGDKEFRQRCVDHMTRMRQEGRTIVLVAHSLPDVLEMCSRAVWLDRGEIQAQGPAEEVVEAYRASKPDLSVAAGAD